MYQENMEAMLHKATEEMYDKLTVRWQTQNGSEEIPTEDELKKFAELNDANNKLRFDNEVYTVALVNMAKASKNIGVTMLLTMWEVWKSGAYMSIMEEDSMEKWADTVFSDYDVDVEYMRSLGRIVDNIIVWAWGYEEDEDPIELDDGRLIVVEGGFEDYEEINLLTGEGTKGLISKLKENAHYFGTLDSNDQKLKFIETLCTQSRKAVKAAREISKNKDRKSKLSGVKFKLTKRHNGDNIEVTFPKQQLTLTLSQYKALLSKFNDYLDIDED